MIEAFAHQHFPFEELDRVLRISRRTCSAIHVSGVFSVIDILKLEKLLVSLLLLLIYDFPKQNENNALSTFNLIFRLTATLTELTATVNYRKESLSSPRAHRIVQVFSKMLWLMGGDPNESLNLGLMQV